MIEIVKEGGEMTISRFPLLEGNSYGVAFTLTIPWGKRKLTKRQVMTFETFSQNSPEMIFQNLWEDLKRSRESLSA